MLISLVHGGVKTMDTNKTTGLKQDAVLGAVLFSSRIWGIPRDEEDGVDQLRN